jgi:hypothetical protein
MLVSSGCRQVSSNEGGARTIGGVDNQQIFFGGKIAAENSYARVAVT